MQRLDSLLLASVGVLLVHQAAYMASALLGYETSVAHGHMALAWFGGSLAILCALARAITNSLKSRNHNAPSEYRLFVAIASGYVLLEQFERAVDGYGAFALLAEPVFWLGLALSPLIALFLHWSVRSVKRIVIFVALAASTKRWPELTSSGEFGFPTTVVPHSTQRACVVSLRGPPADLRL